jgi:multidrug transporter EmrE-like cation transporter
MVYLFFLLGIICNGVASYTLKLLTTGEAKILSLETLANPLFYLTLILFAANVVFYALFLQRVSLAIGYPAFVGGTFLVVLGLSFFLLKETLTPIHILGIGMILVGIFLATR